MMLLLSLSSFSLSSLANNFRCYKNFIVSLNKPIVKNYLKEIELGGDMLFILGKYKLIKKKKARYLTGFYLYRKDNIYFLEMNKRWLRNSNKLKESFPVSLKNSYGRKWKWKKKLYRTTEVDLIKIQLVKNKIKLSVYDKTEFNNYKQEKYVHTYAFYYYLLQQHLFIL